MRHFKLITLIFVILLFGCDSTDEKATLSSSQTSLSFSDEKDNLQKLVRRLYEWHETQSSNNDFIPVADGKDGTYIGVDRQKNKQRLIELERTGFFAEQFLTNYNEIALTIDKELKNKTIKWRVGDLPPFGNDANPWCNCQDNPENYWQTMTIKKISFENNIATFIWTWGDSFEYKAKAIKQNGNWKITYLQGFDFDEFI